MCVSCCWMTAAGVHAGLLNTPPCSFRARISAFVFAELPCHIASANTGLTICTIVLYQGQRAAPMLAVTAVLALALGTNTVAAGVSRMSPTPTEGSG